MTSPRVLKFAQFHFQCPTLQGVELEGRDYGSHWEERIAGDELMSPLTTRVMPLSALTLALLQGTQFSFLKLNMLKILDGIKLIWRRLRDGDGDGAKVVIL